MKRRWRLFPKYALLIMALVGGTLIASSAVGLYFSYRENQDNLAALQAGKGTGRGESHRAVRSSKSQQQLSWTALAADECPQPIRWRQRRIEYLKLLLPSARDHRCHLARPAKASSSCAFRA